MQQPQTRWTQPGFVILALAMACACVLANCWVYSFITSWLSYGSLVYALTFFINELTNRFYGARGARRVVYVGFVLAFAVSFWLSPWRITCAFSVAFLTAQLVDISVFSGLRHRAWWVAPAAASLVATSLDSVMFCLIAFVGTKQTWWHLLLGDLAIKAVVDMCLLGLFRLILCRDKKFSKEFSNAGKNTTHARCFFIP